jgi:pimeloyl-ACP methyl ester carboxylesterase
MLRACPKLLSVALFLIAACAERPAPEALPSEVAWTDPAPHASGFVTAGGHPINYLDWGGTGPTLILVHGFGDTPHVFDDLVPALGGNFRVLAYARRGHGRSGKAGPYDLATLTEDLRALMDSLGIATAHLAGWSMGGNEITAMAARYPDRVERIVYLDAGYDWSDPAIVAGFNDLPVDLAPTGSDLASIEAYTGWQMINWFPGVSDPSRLEAHFRDLVDIEPDGTVQSVMADSVEGGLWGSLTTEPRNYTAVRAPALSIYSETFFDITRGDSVQFGKKRTWEDKYMTSFREASKARLQKELKGIQFLTVPGTHADFVFTSRDQVAEAMVRFLTASQP